MTASPRGVDVQLAGTVYLDLVFTGLAGPPEAGQELRSKGFGASPGGIANLTLALRRLGLAVRLAAIFSTDVFGDDMWRALVAEGVDLGGSVRLEGWPTPVTVSLAYRGDRSMITHECPLPEPVPSPSPGAGPPARAAVAFLGPERPTWLAGARATGSLVVADVGWDESGRWSERDLDPLEHCDAFLPNADEAMAYSRTSSPEAAARRLAERVPLAVVKCSSEGVVAWRAGDDAPVREQPIDVEMVDATGAGDVFDAGFVYGLLAGWPLQHSLRLGNLCAGLSVRTPGGSLSAPGWPAIREWLAGQPPGIAERYRFLLDDGKDMKP